MRRRAGLALVLGVAAAWAAHGREGLLDTPVSVSTFSREEIERLPNRSIVDVINLARTQPQTFAKDLGKTPSPAGREAREFLGRQMPLEPLVWSDHLAAAAQRQAYDQGARGTWSHTGPDGSSVRDRIQGVGLYSSIVAENISLAQTTAGAVVRQLVIDEGVSSRAHRNDIFSPRFTLAGCGCARHSKYGVICVITFSTPPLRPLPPPPPPPPPP